MIEGYGRIAKVETDHVARERRLAAANISAEQRALLPVIADGYRSTTRASICAQLNIPAMCSLDPDDETPVPYWLTAGRDGSGWETGTTSAKALHARTHPVIEAGKHYEVVQSDRPLSEVRRPGRPAQQAS